MLRVNLSNLLRVNLCKNYLDIFVFLSLIYIYIFSYIYGLKNTFYNPVASDIYISEATGL